MSLLGGFGGHDSKRILLIRAIYKCILMLFCPQKIKKIFTYCTKNDVVAKSYCSGDLDKIIWCIL